MTELSLKKSRARRVSVVATLAAADPAQGLFTTSSGAEVYFEDSGGDGSVLFYIYGLACSIQHWKYSLAYFSAGAAAAAGRPAHRQVWLDFRGHGKSPDLPRGASLHVADVVADIQELCAFRGITRATFLGQSLGGIIALELALQAPALAAGLVLLVTPPRDPGRSLPFQPLSGLLWRGLIALRQRLPIALRSSKQLNQLLGSQPLLFAALRELIRRQGFNPSLAKTEDIAEYVRQFLAVDPQLFLAMAGDLAATDAVRYASRITCPTLLLAGAHDRIVPLAESQRLVRHLPKGELVVVPHGSHCPHFDDPGLVNGILNDFLSKNKL